MGLELVGGVWAGGQAHLDGMEKSLTQDLEELSA